MDATPRKRIARVCLTPATAHLPGPSDALLFECIEATQRKFKKSGEEMATLLGLSTQSNYSRRSYNAARVQRLPMDMRQFFADEFARTVGLRVNEPTTGEQVRTAAKLAIVNLLDVMEHAS